MAHPLRVAAGQVVVDGDQVGAAAGQRVEIQRQGGDEGLAFAGGHLGDLALVQHHAADELHVVRHHVPNQLVPGDLDGGAHQPAARLAHGGERLRQQLVQARPQAPSCSAAPARGTGLPAVPLNRIGAAVLGFPDLLELRLERAGALGQPLPKSRRSAPCSSSSLRSLSRSSWTWIWSTMG